MPADSFTSLTPLSFLARAADVFSDKTAIAYGDRRTSYSELAAEATRLAHALRASGVQSGDRVAYMCPNIPEMLVAHFGVPLAGAVLVPVNTRLSAEEVRHICDHSGATLLVVDTEYLPALAPVLDGLRSVTLVVAVDDPLGPAPPDAAALAHVSYDEFLKRGSDEPLPWTVDDEQGLVSINYTSGTTGTPKGVMYAHRGAYLNALGEIIHQRLDPESVYLWTLPMFHCNGWCTPWAVTAIGATHVCLRAVRADVIWQLLDDERVTHLDGAPTVLTLIAGAPQAHPLGRELVATVAGAPPSPIGDHPDARAGSADRARLRHDRDLRSVRPQRVAARLVDAATGRPGTPPGPPGRRDAARGPDPGSRREDAGRSARRPHDGRDRDARQHRHGGLLRRSRSHRDRLPRRLAALRRPRCAALRRLRRAARPGQGHHHLRRREHLDRRDRARDRDAPRRVRGRRHRRSGREVGRTTRRPSSSARQAPRSTRPS